MNPIPRRVRVAVIGAGFSGLGAAWALRRAGITDLIVLERRPGLGGTWWDNTYPGCACDIPSNLYSFSFAANPAWSRSFSRQPEIQRYLADVADRYDLRRSIRFGATLTRAKWQQHDCTWRLQVQVRDPGPICGPAPGATPGAAPGASPEGSDPPDEASSSLVELTADLVVLATGPLSQPAVPAIPGLDGFPGPVMHTAQWRSDVELSGRRVAVVGTGASAVQLIPAIQPRVGRLTVFQRTPAWVIPHLNRPLTRVEHALYRRLPGLQKVVRGANYLAHEAQVGGFVRRPALMAIPQRLALQHLAHQVKDDELRAALTPDYRFGCKRVTPSNTYYPALTRPNVTVVGSALAEVSGHTLIGADGSRHETDVLVTATGFQVTDPVIGPVVTGRGGRTLSDAWRDTGLQALRGTTVAGFPNLFMLVGPGTGLGHNSIVHMIESQLTYLVDAVRALSGQADALEPTQEAQDRWNQRLAERMRGTVWATGGCTSWYQDDQGRVSTLWPYSTLRFRRELRRIDRAEYQVWHRRAATLDPAEVDPAEVDPAEPEEALR